MLNNLIEAMEKSQELKWAWEDFTDVIIVEKLKETYLNTINGGFSSHPEDISENKKVNEAIAVVLRYFMFVGDAQEFLKEAESERKSD
jgi:uncharacterized secreted protein with C-terminal beta-propeller domain